MTTFKSDFLRIMQERGFIHQYTNLEGLDDLLCREKVTAYCGIDPTADSPHAGHLVPYMMLRWFLKCGHQPIILIGGVTGMVGDPTGKDESRKLLTEETVRKNAESLSTFFRGFLPGVKMVNNADWLRGMNYIEFLRDYGTHFSINRMLSMESVKLRLEREEHFNFLEFNYMILQGYDYLHLYRADNCRLQVSGADQWGNVLQGVELARRIEGAELFGLTAPLITTASGKKMGKTEAGALWLMPHRCSPYDFYQYWRNTDDADVGRYLKTFTDLPMAEIGRLEKLKGVEVNEAKKILAFEVTKMIHGEQAATQAAETARKTFEEGAAAEGLPTITLPRARLEEGVPAFVLFKDAGLASSGGEARRLIAGGGARINDEKVENDQQLITLSQLSTDRTIKLSAGKKKHALVVVGD